MNLTSAPYNWNSLWQPIVYIFDHASKVANSIGDNGGFAQWDFPSVFSPLPVVGERFIVTAGTYKGIHVITSVDSTTQFTTSTPYIGGAGAVTTIYERLPEIKLYKGYLSGEAYFTEDPATLVATFRPRTSIDNNVRIDVSGYLQGAFSIVAPVTGVDNNMFSKFRLYFDGKYQTAYHVLNSGLESATVDAYYANTGRHLTSTELPYLLDCGNTLLSRIENDAVINHLYASSGIVGGEFDTDFDTDFSTE